MFAADRKGSILEFLPEQLKSFRFENGKYYVSMEVNVEGKMQRLFLEFLIHGKLDMFYYRDANSDEHYYASGEDGRLIELRNDEKDVYVEGVHYRMESRQYAGVLKVLVKDSPETVKEVDDTQLSHKSLIGVARDYHNSVCMDEKCIIYEKNIPKVSLFLGPEIGVNLNTVSNLRNSFPTYMYYFSVGNWQWSCDPSIGVFVNLVVPLLNERSSVEYKLSANRMTTRLNSYTREDTYDMMVSDDILCTQYSIENAILYKYVFLPSRISPFIDFGGFINYCFSTDYSRHHVMYGANGNIFDERYDTVSPFNKTQYGLVIGGGVNVKASRKFELCLNIRYYAGFGLYTNLLTNTVAISIGMPFRIFN